MNLIIFQANSFGNTSLVVSAPASGAIRDAWLFYSIVLLLLRHHNEIECLGFSHGHSHCLSNTSVSKVSRIVFSQYWSCFSCRSLRQNVPDNISILYSTLNFGSLRVCSSTHYPDGLVDIFTASLIYVCTVQLCCLLLQNTPYLFNYYILNC